MNPIEALERVATFEGYTTTHGREIFPSWVIKNFAQPKIKFFTKKKEKQFDILFMLHKEANNRI